MSTPIIDPEFQSMVPPLTADERQLLEESIRDHGCRHALVTWRGMLLDGHNRLEICTRLGLPYQTCDVDLPDREAAADWIDANQLGRRNLNPDQFSIMAGRRYLREKRRHGGDRKSTAQSEQKTGDSAARLAKQYGVSRATVVRAGQFAEAVNRIREKIDPQIESKVMRGAGPSRSAIVKAASLIEKHPEAAARVYLGDTTITQASRKVKEGERDSRRAENRRRVEQSPDNAIPSDAKFATITIDPPWAWEDVGDNDQFGRASHLSHDDDG